MNDDRYDRSKLTSTISDYLSRIYRDDGLRSGIARAGWEFLRTVASEVRDASARQTRETRLRREADAQQIIDGEEP